MTGHTVRAIASLGLGAAVVLSCFSTGLEGMAQAAPTVADARAQAAALRVQVDRLQLQTEQAAESYDAAQEQLGRAVQEYVAAQQALEASEQDSADQRDAAAARVRSLYESGGTVGLFATALTSGDVTGLMDRMEMARHVLGAADARVAAAGQEVDRLTSLQTRLAALAERRTALQTAAEARQQNVTTLLAQQRAALGRADTQVRALVAAEQLAAQRAAARAFAARLAAARAAAQQPVDNAMTATAPPPPTSVAAAAIAAARTRLGVPYVWGATGPDAFDCSGLTSWAYARAGIMLPRTAAEQWYAGPHIAMADLRPGDLLFWATDTSNPATIHHVAIYIGNDQMIAAPHTGTVVQVQQVYLDGYIGAARPTATPGQ